VSNENITKLV